MRTRALFVFAMSAAASAALISCSGDNVKLTDGSLGDGAGADATSTVPIVTFPTTVSIGAGDCGGTATKTFTVENTGGGALTYSIASSGAVFEVSPASGSIAAHDAATFTVTAHVPADAAPGTPVTGALTITSNASAEAVSVPLSADPRGAVLTLTPASVAFGDVELTKAGSATVSVKNDGNASVGVSFGAPGGDFAVAFTSGALDGKASRDATVSYTPSGLGGDNASSAITIDGVVCGAKPASLPMAGKGVPIGSVLVTGNPAFGSVDCGTVGTVASTITLDNQGAATATWTAAFLTDPDSAFYTLSAASGTINAGAQATFDVNRLAIGLPVVPGAHDVTLRVTTTVASVPTVHDIAVTQTLHGPFLTASASTIDFGYSPTDNTLSKPVTITNSGNASANATYTPSGMYFGTQETGGTIAGSNGTAIAHVQYSPANVGTTNGSVVIAAPGSCSGQRTITLTAGDGAWTDTNAIVNVGRSCTTGSNNPASMFVLNPGTKTLTLSNCVDLNGTDIKPVFTPLPLSVGSGNGSASLQVDWSDPSPLKSGKTTATIRCNTNEKFFTTRTFQLTRTMTGADLVLAAVDTLDFSCSGPQNQQHFIKVTNNGNQSAFLFSQSSLPNGMFTIGGSFTLDPGATDMSIGAGLGSSGCTAGESGTLGLFTGSGNEICSVTPADHLTVTTSP